MDRQQQSTYISSYAAYYHPHQYPNYYQQHQDYANYYNQPQSQSQPNSSPIRPPGVSTPPPDSSNPVASSNHAQIHHDFEYYHLYQQRQFQPQQQHHMVFGRVSKSTDASVIMNSFHHNFEAYSCEWKHGLDNFYQLVWHFVRKDLLLQGPCHGQEGLSMNPKISLELQSFTASLELIPLSPVSGSLLFQSERTLHKGHRKRGGKSFMRGGHAALTHGRGRDWSSGQHFPPLASASTASNLPHAASTPAPGGPPKASIQPPLASGPSMAPFPTQAHASLVPIRPSRMAWCELCRVDCNTFEILEQHKNGKKHKKKELQKLKKVMTGTITEQMSVPISIFQPNVVQRNAKAVDLKQESPGKLPVEDSICDTASSDDRNGERDQQKNLPEKVQNPVAELKENQAGEQKMDHSGVCGRGLKRHLRGGQGAKRMRTNQWHRRQAEPSKPKEVISLTCKLCNVKCGSQVVFDSHLAGKKHLSKLKKFHGNQPILGNGDLQATFSTNPNTSSFNLAHIDQQTLLGCRNFLALLVEYILPRATAAAFAPTAAPLQANGSVSEPPLALASESASETHQQQIPNREMSKVSNVAPLQQIPPDLPVKDPPASQSPKS
ncbi:hypothetical protein RJ641_017013 [Dillenia turbinata]|uniref:U1-type domain-containing protein n=1 Tax=Dillenia turbinata TaxID=194707 RepID=A0AAN8UV22_9MAGN